MKIRYTIVRIIISLSAIICVTFLAKEEKIILSEADYAEFMKNPKDDYISLNPDLSDIKDLIIVISKLDKDKKSILHAFKRYVRHGFTIALYDEVIHVLEYAEFIVQKKALEIGKKKMKPVMKRLRNIINKVLNKSLHCNFHLFISPSYE
jgi:hypothetical protein